MMVARRSRGEGSLFWNEKRQRWIGIVSQGYAANGKRRTTWVSGRTKTEAKTKLREGAASSGRWSAGRSPRLHGALLSSSGVPIEDIAHLVGHAQHECH